MDDTTPGTGAGWPDDADAPPEPDPSPRREADWAGAESPEAPLEPYVGPEVAWPAADPFPASAAEPSAARHSFWRYALVGLAAGALGAALATGGFLLWADGEPTVVERVETRIVSATGGEAAAAEVARAVLPSIVTVEVRATDVGEFVAEASGSGVVLTGDGLLVTNEHVVAGAVQVRVIFAGGRTYPAEIVGQDAVTDLAVLRIDAAGLTPIALGSSEDMAIGDTAIAVGSPLGLEGGPSVTVGVISAFDRRVRTGEDEELFGMIQTDAPITRGSSGGALVDGRGRLVGITTAIGVSDVGAEGLGFAIPVELVAIVADQLTAQGVASHPFLGITGTTYFRQEADGATVPAGVLIAEVLPGTAAEAAGLAPGDLMLSVRGAPLATMEQLVVDLRFYRVGDPVEIEIERGGERQTLVVTLMERPEGV